MFTDRLALTARQTARRALDFQKREVRRRVLGTFGLLVGLWGLALGSSWLAASGALTILLSHMALRFWWLRLLEKAAVAGAGAALAVAGDPLLDAAGAVLLFSTAGALLLTLCSELWILDQTREIGRLEERLEAEGADRTPAAIDAAPEPPEAAAPIRPATAPAARRRL